MKKLLFILFVVCLLGCKDFATDPESKKCIPGVDFKIQDISFSSSSYSSTNLIIHNEHSFSYSIEFDYYVACTSTKGVKEEKYASKSLTLDAYETTSESIGMYDEYSCEVTITATRPYSYSNRDFTQPWSGSYKFAKTRNLIVSD